MTKVFLDSNILIYLYASDEIRKTQAIQHLLKKYQHIFISTQVLFEFSYAMHRKLKRSYEEIEHALEEFYEAFDIFQITYEMIRCALKLASKYKYSFADSLIIVAALEADCGILFSEDMHHDQVIEHSLRLINPFH